MFKRIWRKLAPNPLDQLLKRAIKKNSRSFLITWNRGLGDIPLGLYALVHRIRQFVPNADITFITRPDLEQAFQLLNDIKVIVEMSWKRGEIFNLKKSLNALGKDLKDFDLILENPDPTYWLKWQISVLVPKLCWREKWDALSGSFGLSPDVKYIGVHVQTETNYGYQKNWPLQHWLTFFQKISENSSHKIILFGFDTKPLFSFSRIIDLRGKTNLFEMLSIIKNYCSYLVVPDSGVLSITYYINKDFPLKIVSLWADPFQGVLKQNVPSPNAQLVHLPLIGQNRDISQISVEKVITALFTGPSVEIGGLQ